MAKISLILLVPVLTVSSVLMSKVSNVTQRLRSTVNNDPIFTDCPGVYDGFKRNHFLNYFIEGQMPSGLFQPDDPNVLYLCQTDPPRHDIPSYFSTIFDTTTKNAILSAYYVTKEQALLIGNSKRPSNPWKSKHSSLSSWDQYEKLYKEGTNAKDYDRGHLLPFSIYSFDNNYGKSTFDYSNAVPQRANWNRGAWNSFEQAIKRYTQLTCGCRYRGKMYLLTGTSQFYKNPLIKQPEMKITANTRKHRRNGKFVKMSITIPKVMWTAGCCVGSDPKSGKQKVESIAVIGKNLPQNTRTEATEVSQLQLWLKNRHGPVELFPGQPACSNPGSSYILKV